MGNKMSNAELSPEQEFEAYMTKFRELQAELTSAEPVFEGQSIDPDAAIDRVAHVITLASDRVRANLPMSDEHVAVIEEIAKANFRDSVTVNVADKLYRGHLDICRNRNVAVYETSRDSQFVLRKN